MINCADIQKKYIELYKCVRDYIWEFHVVEALADLEVACFMACPNVSEIKRCLLVFKSLVKDVALEDEDLSKALDSFEDLVSSEEPAYSKLNKVKEVVQV